MNYNKFHKLIEEQNPEEKEALYERLKAKLNLPEEPKEVKTKQSSGFRSFFKKPARIISCASAALVVICLAIVIPLALNNKVPEERYCTASDCVLQEITSIKEYAEENQKSILYLDWYDTADEIQTELYVNSSDLSDLIYIKEKFFNSSSNQLVNFYLTDNHTRVDVFEGFLQNCLNESIYNSTKVNWINQNSKKLAYFEYGGYRYYIEMVSSTSEQTILEIVESVLP